MDRHKVLLSIFWFERTRWRLFQKRTWWRLLWAYLMKVIMSVPDEGYYERHLMKVIMSVPDEGYSRNALYALNSISMFHSLLLVIWNWTNVKICSLNETFYKKNRIHGYVYLIFKNNESYDTRKQTDSRNTSAFCLD